MFLKDFLITEFNCDLSILGFVKESKNIPLTTYHHEKD